jgi:hypothetical protein
VHHFYNTSPSVRRNFCLPHALSNLTVLYMVQSGIQGFSLFNEKENSKSLEI